MTARDSGEIVRFRSSRAPSACPFDASRAGTAQTVGMAESRSSWASFSLWTILGAGFSVGLLSILTIGIFVLATTTILAMVVVRRRAVGADLAGVVSGLGLPLLYVALLNRQGPGTVCTVVANGTSCTDESSPWLWLGTGMTLIVVGLGTFLTCRRNSSTPVAGTTPPPFEGGVREPRGPHPFSPAGSGSVANRPEKD
jgi:hypothetical protein